MAEYLFNGALRARLSMRRGLFGASNYRSKRNYNRKLGVAPVQDLQGDTSKLPVEVFEDRSLVYPNIPQR